MICRFQRSFRNGVVFCGIESVVEKGLGLDWDGLGGDVTQRHLRLLFPVCFNLVRLTLTALLIHLRFPIPTHHLLPLTLATCSIPVHQSFFI